MMSIKNAFSLFCILILGLYCSEVYSQIEVSRFNAGSSTAKLYVSTGGEGSILSSAILKKPDGGHRMGIPRYTFLLNLGAHLNYDFNEHVGLYTGLNLKNIGYIDRENGIREKRRVFTLGVPIALKFGKIRFGNYFMVGGGVDFPFNYREKDFIKRGHKLTKFNEWFSDRTPAALPYVFIGEHIAPGLALRLYYYPTNFLNSNYQDLEDNIVIHPYQGRRVNLIMLTAGFEIPFRPR